MTALVTWWAWGSLRQVAVYHDEVAYILQAELFASGRWTAPAHPLPEFFEQYHVLVTPVVASKYWPGHSLVMAPGIWVGLPGLVPILLVGLTGALCFALARRVANPWVAALAWFFWTTAPGALDYRASYFSEVTTGALWLLGWWALLDWLEGGRRGALLAVAACVGWTVITRPLTGLAFAIPVAVVVLRHCYRQRAWRDLGVALVLGGAVLFVIPLWSARTTGDWRTTPYALYARMYFPLGMPGDFGRDSTPPTRSLPPDMARFAAGYRKGVVRPHTVSALPRELAKRMRQIGDDMWHGWRALLLPCAILGLFALPAGASFAVVTAALLILVHLSFPHGPAWSLYYYESQPVLGFLSALGVGAVALRVRAWLGRRPSGLVAVALSIAALYMAARDVRAVRRAQTERQAFANDFAAVLQRIPAAKAILFVRYKPDHNVNAPVIANEADLDRARVWLVYDRGPDNARLTALAPDRTPYLYDEATRTVTALPRPTAR